ncbi:MAG: hypothetical protein ACFFA0_04680 [Promethearchaeota archaeon]
MNITQITILIILSFGILIFAIIVLLIGLIAVIKEKFFGNFILTILLGISIIFLMPVLIGLIKELY